MIELVLVFFCGSVLLYAIFGGADFGAGIVELFSTGAKTPVARRTVTHALAPVWEANHVWLILAIVILFNAFPPVFYTLSVTFHIPLTLMLIGVVFRGCAFTFRHYDAVEGERSYHWYSTLFQFGSVLTPLMQGMIVGAVLLGRVGTTSFVDRFVSPWLNPFCFSVGCFTCALDVLLASVFLVGETDDPKLKEYFVACSRVATAAVCVLTAVVFGLAHSLNVPLMECFFNDPVCQLVAALALFTLVAVQLLLPKRRTLDSRVAVSLFVALVLIGFCRVHFPRFPEPEGARSLISWTDGAAPKETLRFLLIALTTGIFTVLPALGFLLRTFKLNDRAH
ncbi:MAG: cytochrome d ubiquinol oxidase subunit II [Bdellovibrionota bacterium]